MVKNRLQSSRGKGHQAQPMDAPEEDLAIQAWLEMLLNRIALVLYLERNEVPLQNNHLNFIILTSEENTGERKNRGKKKQA